MFQHAEGNERVEAACCTPVVVLDERDAAGEPLTRVERELSDRDTHAVGTEIAESKDAATIRDDDDGGASWPVAKQIHNATRVLRG
jgi:hypothetical protein